MGEVIFVGVLFHFTPDFSGGTVRKAELDAESCKTCNKNL